MTTDEKFNEIYKKIVNENAEDMEIARGEAQVENRHNKMILATILLLGYVGLQILYAIDLLVIDNEVAKFIVIFPMIILIILSLGIYEEFKKRGGKSKIEKYTKEFKTKIIGPMIKSFEEQLEFAPQYRIIFNSF